MKEMALGTALWGWSVEKTTAFQILDFYYQNGGRFVDTANNYPLNGNSQDYQKSALFVSEWIRVNGIRDLKVFFKVGSLSNKNTPANDLSLDFLGSQTARAQEQFGPNLDTVMIHWDDRAPGEDIAETTEFLQSVAAQGYGIGLSGIKNPSNYIGLLCGGSIQNLNIQIKYNFLDSSLDDYKALDRFHPKFWAYGIGVSGLKLSEEAYTPRSYVRLARNGSYHKSILTKPVRQKIEETLKRNRQLKSIYHIALAFSERSTQINGYLIAPTTIDQLKDISDFKEKCRPEQLDLSALSEAPL